MDFGTASWGIWLLGLGSHRAARPSPGPAEPTRLPGAPATGVSPLGTSVGRRFPVERQTMTPPSPSGPQLEPLVTHPPRGMGRYLGESKGSADDQRHLPQCDCHVHGGLSFAMHRSGAMVAGASCTTTYCYRPARHFQFYLWKRHGKQKPLGTSMSFIHSTQSGAKVSIRCF